MVEVERAKLVDILASELMAEGSESPEGGTRRVILWLDPAREFERLWPFVAESLQERSTVSFKSGLESEDQLSLKLALLRLESRPGGRAVVYLPGFAQSAVEPRADGTAPELWAVYEYLYKGAIWSLDGPEAGRVRQAPTLLGWLQRNGLRVADGPSVGRLTAGGKDSLLARYAEARRNSSPYEWPSPLKESEVLAALGGDSRDASRALLT